MGDKCRGERGRVRGFEELRGESARDGGGHSFGG